MQGTQAKCREASFNWTVTLPSRAKSGTTALVVSPQFGLHPMGELTCVQLRARPLTEQALSVFESEPNVKVLDVGDDSLSDRV